VIIQWDVCFALLSHFYHLSPRDIVELTLYQFWKYIHNIPKVLKVIHKGEFKQLIKRRVDPKEMKAKGKQVGLKMPKEM